jgi:hypothetical protein
MAVVRWSRIVATLAPDALGVATTKGISRGVDEIGNVYSSVFLPAGNKPYSASAASPLAASRGFTLGSERRERAVPAVPY